MRILNLLAVLAAVTNSGNSGLILWGDLRAGMDRADVKSQFKSRAVELGTKCYARIAWEFESGRLTQVHLNSLDDTPACKSLAINSLYQKYGAAAGANSAIMGGDCPTRGAGGKICAASGGNDVYTSQVVTWIHDGVVIEFHTAADINSWMTVYRPQEHIESGDLSKF